jgi:dUTP pyrophosphatase
VIIYYAEPIDQDNANYVEVEYRKSMVTWMLGRGHNIFRPATAWEVFKIDQAASRGIERVNREALRNADLLVARLPEGTPSIGVPMEIEYATRTLGIPAIVSGVGGVALMGNPGVRLVGGSRTMDNFAKTFIALEAERPAPNPPLYHVGNLTPRTYSGDAGIDLVCSERTVIRAGQTARVPTGNRFGFPERVWGWIVSRSSTFETFGIQILPGIIDEGYTGELFANALNPSNKDIVIEPGDRVCQIILFDNVTARYNPTQVAEIEVRDRGSNGFGSTGRNGHFLNNGPDWALMINPQA